MFWIAATGKGGKDLFDASLAERDGHYGQYRKGDINAMHIAYFRRRNAHEGDVISFQTVNLRKSTVHDSGPLVKQAADPIPSCDYAHKPYRLRVIKYGPHFGMFIKDRHRAYNGWLKVLEWKDDGEDAPVLEGGKIGFRQMRGLIADYSNLKVHRVPKED